MLYFGNLSRQEYDEFDTYSNRCILNNTNPVDKLILSKMPFPHEELAILYNVDYEKINNFCLSKGFFSYKYSPKITLVKRTPFLAKEKEGIMFSGYMFDKNNFIFGKDSFFLNNLHTKYKDIKNSYGEYVIFKVDEQGIELSSDYFGMVSIFYYHSSKKFVASNNYHFLLELLNSSGEKLHINIKQSQVNLLSNGYEIGGAFSRDMDIQGIRISYPYENIKYNSQSDNLEICNTDLYSILNNPEPWDDELYESYISQGVEDLKNNTESIFLCDRFKKVIVDLSAGFDSRVVFGSADSLPNKKRKKMYIFSRPSHNLDDKDLANFVRKIFGYKPYSYVDVNIDSVEKKEGINLAQVSRNLGSFGNHTENKLSSYDENVDRIELMGGMGDALLGYKRVNGYLNFDSITSDEKEDQLIDRLGRLYFMRSINQMTDIFDAKRELLKTLFNEFNADCIFKKLHILYIISRNRFHFGSSRNIFHNNTYALPLQSKYLLKAKWMYFNKFSNNQIPDEKVSFDVLHKLNPLLTILPFAAENDDVIPKPNNLLHPILVRIPYDNSTKNEEPIYSDLHITGDKYVDQVAIYMQNVERAKCMLAHISNKSGEFRDICTAFYKLLNRFENEGKNKGYMYYNVVRKIYDLYFQLKYVE